MRKCGSAILINDWILRIRFGAFLLKDSGDRSVRIENDVGFVIVGIANASLPNG